MILKNNLEELNSIKSGQSSTSKYLQQNVPSPDGTYTKKSSTNEILDDSIIKNLKTSIFKTVQFMNCTQMSDPITIEEKTPTNSRIEYEYATVSVQKESGITVIYDDTPKNRRIHTQHSSGTYNTILDDGSTTNKIIKDYDLFIGGTKREILDKSYYLQINNDFYTDIKGSFKNNVSGEFGAFSNGNQYYQTNGHMFNTAEGDIVNKAVGQYQVKAINAKYEFSGSVEQQSQEYLLKVDKDYRLITKNTEILTADFDINSKGINIQNSGSFICKNNGGFVLIGGTQQGTIQSAGLDEIVIGKKKEVYSSLDSTCGLKSEETILSVGKFISVIAGAYDVSVKTGMMNMSVLSGKLSISAQAGVLEATSGTMATFSGKAQTKIGFSSTGYDFAVNGKSFLVEEYAKHDHLTFAGPTNVPRTALKVIKYISKNVSIAK